MSKRKHRVEGEPLKGTTGGWGTGSRSGGGGVLRGYGGGVGAEAVKPGN